MTNQSHVERLSHSHILTFSHKSTLLSSTELEKPLVVPLRQRHRQPRHFGASWLWYHIQHMWPTCQLPPGFDSDQDAGTRYSEPNLIKSLALLALTQILPSRTYLKCSESLLHFSQLVNDFPQKEL